MALRKGSRQGIYRPSDDHAALDGLVVIHNKQCIVRSLPIAVDMAGLQASLFRIRVPRRALALPNNSIVAACPPKGPRSSLRLCCAVFKFFALVFPSFALCAYTNKGSVACGRPATHFVPGTECRDFW